MDNAEAELTTRSPRRVPTKTDDYGEQLARRTGRAPSLLDVDWLLTRPLARNIELASARFARGTLLDVGCGARPYEHVLRKSVGKYFGVDTPASTESLIDVAAIASELPIASSSVDTVLCTEVLEHLSDPA
jgi:2-polyprenyl-3-methyl-5-hydroxy-6-metoxy-1,4-benzoquinol methylase